MSSKIYFATGNKGKAKEAGQILGVDVEVVDIDLIEIQSADEDEIVTHKLIEAYKKINAPVMVDDVSLRINVWNGFPGPFIKFLHNSLGIERIAKMVGHEGDRSASIVATVGYHDGERIHIFKGVLEVNIVDPRGDKGWGLDPILEPKGMNLTFSEMQNGEKNEISHRGIALNKLAKHLSQVGQ